MKTCNTCKYWEVLIEYNDDTWTEEIVDNIGSCKRHAYLERYAAIEALKEGQAFAAIDYEGYDSDILTRGDIFSCNQYQAK